MRYLPFLLAFAFALYAFIDCLQTPNTQVRQLPKAGWLVLVWFPLLGGIGWLVYGRSHDDAPPPVPPRRHQVAPDDDPEFLRTIRDVDAEHERMLQQWEDDLRKRERDLHDRDEDGPTPA